MSGLEAPFAPPVATARWNIALSVDVQGDRDAEERFEIRQAALAQLAHAIPDANIGFFATHPNATLDVSIAIHDDTTRTYLLDALWIYPGLGIFPLSPTWGAISVDLVARPVLEGQVLDPLTVHVAAEHSTIFYGLVREGDAAELAARRAVDESLRALGAQAAQAFGAALTATSTAPRPPATAALAAIAPVDRLLPEEGARVVVRPVRPASENPFVRYLAALGGVEGAYFRGLATVDTEARRKNGEREIVGAGRATTEGYRVSLWKPPDRTGFFFPLALGFLSQDVEIEGFTGQAPPKTGGVSDGRVIEAVVTDPNTGRAADPFAISYFLKMRSGYASQAAVANLVLGDDDVQFFATARAALNLIEVRDMTVIYDTMEKAFVKPVFLHSGSLGAQTGVVVPAAHLALRAAFDAELYRAFEYPEPIDFRGQYRMDAVTGKYERERVFAEAVDLVTFNMQFSLVVML